MTAVHLFWIALPLLALWAFAPRLMRGSANPRVQRMVAFLDGTGRWLGLALLGLFAFGLGFAVLVGFPV